MWREMLDDLRFAGRLTSRNRVAVGAVLGTVILGIGVTTAVFSVVNGVLLRPLPFRGSDRIVQFSMTLRSGVSTPQMAYPDMQDYARDAGSFDAFATVTLDGLTLTQGATPQQLLTARVSDGYARVFDIRPVLGRFFSADEFRPNVRVVMLGHSVWTQQFGSDPRVVGRAVSIENTPYTIVGVLPAARYTYPFPNIQLLTPLVPAPGTYQMNRGALWLRAVGRMKPGISLDRARREVGLIADRLAAAYPDANGGLGVRLTPLHEIEVGDVRPMLVLLSVAVAAVLLIACANIGNVLLGVSQARARELAVRVALGGSVGRIRRQLLTETVALAVVGGVLGTLLAPFVTRVLIALYPGTMPRAAEVTLDVRVLLVAALVTFVAGLTAGWPAALRATRLDLTRDLRDGSRGGTGSLAQRRASGLVVISQVALSIGLIFSATLLLKTFRTLSNTDPGFAARDLTTFQLSASRTRYADAGRVSRYYEAVDRALREIPGARAVATASEVPFSTNEARDIFIPQERGDRGRDNPQVRVGTVSADYWRTLGIPVRAGRAFTSADEAGAPRVVVINDALARQVYPGENPVGRIIHFGEFDWRIVGIVGSVRMGTVAEAAEPELYVPAAQNVQRYRYVFVKSSIATVQLIPQLRQALARVDSTIAVTEIASIDERLADLLAPQRFRASLVGALGTLALLLSTLGIYGVVAYSVGRRTREIGIRLALGEEQEQIRRRVVLSALRMARAGIVGGVVLALFASRWLAAFVVGVNPRDPVLLAAAVATITAVAVLAAYLPARRASRIDPLVALRSD